MLELKHERKFFRMLWSNNPKDEGKFISYVEDNKPKTILSATVNRIYLNAMLQYNAFDKFYIFIEDLLKVNN